jgi:hypothetical protein
MAGSGRSGGPSGAACQATSRRARRRSSSYGRRTSTCAPHHRECRTSSRGNCGWPRSWVTTSTASSRSKTSCRVVRALRGGRWDRHLTGRGGDPALKLPMGLDLIAEDGAGFWFGSTNFQAMFTTRQECRPGARSSSRSQRTTGAKSAPTAATPPATDRLVSPPTCPGRKLREAASGAAL